MRPSPQVVAFGSPKIFIVDYFQSNIGVQVHVISGGPATVEFTLDDVNDATITPVWILCATPLNSVVADAAGFISQSPVRALRYTCTVGGSARFTAVEGSGDAIRE